MKLLSMTVAAGLLVPVTVSSPAQADPGDEWRKQFEIRAECDKKLYEAKSRREFAKELRECRKKLAEWDAKQREEAYKAWAEREKKWRERWDD